jgi:hypothetical protein
MKTKRIFPVLLAVLMPSGLTYADAEQSYGGWGNNCWSGNVNCASGRSIGCSMSAADNSQRSLCKQHTGNVAWVSCYLYDAYGNTLSSYSDQCP